VIAALVAAAVAAAAPGITATEVAIGGADGTAARGAGAYFAYVNERGGVNGRAISFQLDPAPATVFGAVAAAPVEGVPELGAVGPGPGAEGEAYGRYVAATLPTAPVAVLHDPLDDGLAGLRRGLGAKRSLLAGAVAVDVTTDLVTALAELQATGATVLCLLAGGDDAVAALAQLRWKPRLLVRGASAPPAGAISATTLKEPASPRWAGDPGVALYRQVLARYAKGADARDQGYLAGMASARAAVDQLRAAGRAPTRAAAARAAASLNQTANPFLLPGSGPRPGGPLRLRLQQRVAGRWELLGGLLTVRA
jgi:hypothetical protein